MSNAHRNANVHTNGYKVNLCPLLKTISQAHSATDSGSK